MPAFISKLQHKTYETGEFSDERPRNLEETIELIKAFPWEEERRLTDVQPTGPSVTIMNNRGEYLKIGLYFNGKFCIYYLDSNNTLYERAYKTLDLTYETVRHFFNDKFKPEGFDKPLLNFRNRKHFITQSFEYTFSIARLISVNIFLLIYVLIFPIMILLKNGINDFSPIMIFPLLIFMGIPGTIISYIIIKVFPSRFQYLQISRGHDVFRFGEYTNQIREYNKNDIANIITYSAKGNRNPISLIVYEVNFVDKTTIKFTNLVISDTTFVSKFCDSFDKFSSGNRHPLRAL